MIDRGQVFGLVAWSVWRFGPRGSHLYPLDQIGDDAIFEWFLGGHFEVFVSSANGLDEEAFFWMAGDDGWSCVSTFCDVRKMIEAQAVDGFFATVTFETSAHQDGSDFLFKKFDLLGFDLGGAES